MITKTIFYEFDTTPVGEGWKSTTERAMLGVAKMESEGWSVRQIYMLDPTGGSIAVVFEREDS